jgi:hypothetical protein
MQKRLDNILHTLYNRYIDLILEQGLTSWNVNATYVNVPHVHVRRSNYGWPREAENQK